MKRAVVIVVLVACLIDWMHAAVSLADSGYPMPGANPQRNFKTNKPIRCASVSNGKTTVLNFIHAFPNTNAPPFLTYTTAREVALDDKGWAYITANKGTYNAILRFNTTDGSYNDTVFFSTAGDNPRLTLLSEGVLYFSGQSTTNSMNTTNFQSIATFTDPVNFGYYSSMAPYKNDWLVKSLIETDLNNTFTVMYYKDSAASIDTSFPNITADFTGTSTREVLVYKSTTSTTEFPVVAGYSKSIGSPTVVASPSYTTTLPNAYTKNVAIVDNEIVVSTYDYVSGIGFYKLNAATGAVTLNQTYTSWNGSTSLAMFSSLMYHNGKALAIILVAGGQTHFADLVSGQTVLATNLKALDRSFAFSNVDQTVLSLVASQDSFFEILGFDWDTWDINVRARVPHYFNNDVSYGSVVIGDDCRVHVGINQQFYTLAPLPIQNVIPILECVDRNTRIGYFTYNNTGSKSFSIPQVNDRNNLSPLNTAPVEVFAAGFGPNFPFSARVPLNTSNSFTWILEDYILSFTISSDLYCPETISFGIILTANGTFPQGFNLVVRDAFINVTGISGSRVTLVAKKRSIEQEQNSLETDLSVAPDPTNSEPTPAEVVQQFTTQQNEFTQQLQEQPGAPDNIQTSLTGKTPSNAVQGQVPPQPLAPPTSAPPTPVSNPTSSANVQSQSMRALVLVIGSIAFFSL